MRPRLAGLSVVSTWPDERSRNGGVDEIPIPGEGRLWLCGKHFVGPDAEAVVELVGRAERRAWADHETFQHGIGTSMPVMPA